MNEESTSRRREWVFFGALAAILLLVIVGTAALRPLIFGRIVPAVLGLQAEEQPLSAPTPMPEPTPVPDVSDELPPLEEPPLDSPSLDEPPEEATEEPAGDPTALPTISYVVQSGDNLTRIADRHGVSVALLVELNQIENPDRLVPGTVLIIPTR